MRGALSRVEGAVASLRRAPLHDVHCAFCRGSFDRADLPLSCPRCDALLHDACWHEARRCPSLGCVGPPVRVRPVVALGSRPSGRQVVAAGLQAMALALWTAIGLRTLVLSIVTFIPPRPRLNPLNEPRLLVALALVWWLVLVVQLPRSRAGRAWLDRHLPLVGAGFAMAVGFVLCAMG